MIALPTTRTISRPRIPSAHEIQTEDVADIDSLPIEDDRIPTSFISYSSKLKTAKKRPCSWAATTVYYVSNSEGDDSNDGLSESTPVQTLDKASELYAAASSNTLIRFKRGDTWEETGENTGSRSGTNAILLNTANTGIDAYGSGDKPVFNRFINKFTSGWTVSSGNVYVQNVSIDVAWVRLSSAPLMAFYRASDSVDAATDVDDSAGSFYYDNSTGDLYVNLGGTDPNTVEIEVVDSNSESCFDLFSDGTYVKNCVGYGWGINRTDTDSQATFVRLGPTGTGTNLAENVEAYYGSSHVLHHNSFVSSAGGIAIFDSCTAGYSMYNSGGNTIFNSYNNDGGQEYYLWNCEVAYGTLPSSDWYGDDNAIISGTSSFIHTGTGDYAFMLCDGMICHNNPFGAANGCYSNDPPTASSLSEIKSIAMNEILENDRLGINQLYFGLPNGLRVNAYIKGYMDRRSTRAVTNLNQAGYAANCTYDIDFDASLNNVQGMFNGSGNSIQFDYCRFIQRTTNSTQDLRINYDDGTTWSTGALRNSIVGRVGTYDISGSIDRGDPEVSYLAGYNLKGQTGSDPNFVEITDEAEVEVTTASELTSDMAIYNAADTSVGIFVEFDREMNGRSETATSIGDIG